MLIKAKGKRITTWQVAEIKELEPIKFPEPVPDTTGESEEEEEETLDNDNEKSEEKVTNSKIKEKEEKEKEEDKSEEKAPFIEEKKAERTEIDINDIDDITGQMTLF